MAPVHIRGPVTTYPVHSTVSASTMTAQGLWFRHWVSPLSKRISAFTVHIHMYMTKLFKAYLMKIRLELKQANYLGPIPTELVLATASTTA